MEYQRDGDFAEMDLRVLGLGLCGFWILVFVGFRLEFRWASRFFIRARQGFLSWYTKTSQVYIYITHSFGHA